MWCDTMPLSFIPTSGIRTLLVDDDSVCYYIYRKRFYRAARAARAYTPANYCARPATTLFSRLGRTIETYKRTRAHTHITYKYIYSFFSQLKPEDFQFFFFLIFFCSSYSLSFFKRFVSERAYSQSRIRLKTLCTS